MLEMAARLREQTDRANHYQAGYEAALAGIFYLADLAGIPDVPIEVTPGEPGPDGIASWDIAVTIDSGEVSGIIKGSISEGSVVHTLSERIKKAMVAPHG